jgi:hypothetical protein
VADRIGCLGILENRYARDVLEDILKEGEALQSVRANGSQTTDRAKRPKKQPKK